MCRLEGISRREKMEGKNRGILGRFHTFVCEITREKTSMDHKKNMSVFGIRPLMEAVDSGKIPDKIFIQRGLRGEAAAELMHMLKEHSLVYSLVP